MTAGLKALEKADELLVASPPTIDEEISTVLTQALECTRALVHVVNSTDMECKSEFSTDAKQGALKRSEPITRFVNRIVSSWLLGEKPRDSACRAPTAGAPAETRTTGSVTHYDGEETPSTPLPLGRLIIGCGYRVWGRGNSGCAA